MKQLRHDELIAVVPEAINTLAIHHLPSVARALLSETHTDISR